MLRSLKVTKMVQPNQIPIVATLILLLLLQPSVEAKKSRRKVICPIGFQIAYSNIKVEPICYRLKGPEKLTDKYVGCTGNMYTSKLYNSLNLTKPELVLWTEYKSLYPGGPFIDYSFTKSTGSLLETTFEVDNPQQGIDEELCVVIDPVSNFTTARCDETYYRYCIVEPYAEPEGLSEEGCEEPRGYWRFWSPKATCLSPATAVGGGAVRATWLQSKEICEKRGGTILYNGWRYSNNPLLHISGSVPVYPLGITYDPERNRQIVSGDVTLLDCGGWFPLVSPSVTQSPFEFETWGCCRYEPKLCGQASLPILRDVLVLSPPAVWEDASIGMISGNETSYGAVRNGLWDSVNSSYVFFDVICEKNIELKKVDLVVKSDEQNKLILTISDNVDEENIHCFTDSETFTPTPVKISLDDIHINQLLSYVLKPIGDGYYWCVHTDSKRFLVSESNKALWVREELSLRYHFAVKIALKKEYRFDNLERLEKIWEKKLKEYIFYSTSYYKINGGADQVQDPKDFEDALIDFKLSHPDLNPKEKDILYGMKTKKVFLDRKTVLVHLQLNPRMKPVQPGTWDNIEIVYMKPVYYCIADSHEFVESITVQCQIHRCVGNFNDGVQVVTTMDDNCYVSTQVPLLFHNAVTLQMPTPGRIEPELPIEEFLMDSKDSDSSEESTKPPPKPLPNPPGVTTPNATESVTIEPTTTESNTEVFTVPTSVSETVMTATPTFTTTEATTPMPTDPTTLAPEDQLQQVISDLENLINNDAAPMLVEDISTAFDQVDELLAENINLNIPGELLHLLDGIGNRLDLDGNENATTIRDNIALLVTDAQPDLPVRGLRIAARENDQFKASAFEIIRDEFDDTHLESSRSEAVVKLPDSVSNSSRRISFVVFRNDRAFHSPSSKEFFVNSRVLSVNVENLTQFDVGESVDIHFSSLTGDPDRNQSRACAFWHFLESGKGYWSQEGCTFIRATQPGMLDTCRCNHLTHFAEILVPRAVFSERNEQVLELISVIGCCLSIFGLTMIGVTASLFRSWRRDFNNKIWLQLCIAILLLVICFLVIVFAKFDNYDIPCMLVGVLLHYSVLASFCWMLVAAVLSYRRLVMVFTRDASHKLLRASAFSWGAPCAVVGILLSVAPHSYAGRFEEKTPTGAFCYPSGLSLWLAVYAPIAVMLFANWTLFVLIVRSVFASRRIQRHGDSNEALRCASVSCLLVFLFGLPWIFGLFANNIVLAYLFALTATFQGFVLFIFFVVGNKKTRDLWLNKLKIKQTRKVPVTSSTYTNRSTGPGWRGGGGQTSVEAKVSKPRSLASPDDSRFS